MTDSKKKNEAQDHRICSLESNMDNFKKNQANMNASMKNLENWIGELAHSMKESSSRSFPSDLENSPKGSGKELGDSKEVENVKLENEKEEVKVDKK